jgi:signal transduction histidine kinase
MDSSAANGGDAKIPSEVDPSTGDILVVDDDPANLVAIQAALGNLDGRIVRARSGSEALAQLLVRDFALILLDVKMPSMDGLETARMVRSRKRSRHTPIIFITAYGRDDGDVLEAYALGAVDFLFKPLVAEVLRAKAAVFVELQRRTAKVALQAELLREHERKEHGRMLEAERRRWESESLRRQMQDLEAADRRKDEFLALLSHELRNPLAPIVAGLALLREKLSAEGLSDPSTLRACETMQRQAKHLTRLVDDLLDVSRITSGKVELQRTVLSVQDIVEHALMTSRPLIDERQHCVSIDVPPTPMLVVGDGVRLVQALANLLNNAARYTQPGGTIRVQCTQEEGWAVISITDSGQGIAPEFLPRIFEMFVQERGALGGGLGLGLTLAAEFVERHGGTVTATSDGVGLGSRFVVRLPTDQALADADMNVQSPACITTEAKPLVIVLIDDHPDIREMMQELLKARGHTVEVAENGENGVELVLRLRPDLALVDIGLPDIDGYDVAARVRRTLGQRGPRLVAMTGFGRDIDKRMAKDAGFDIHLVKPVDSDALNKVLSFEEV